jgi:hypothetical protein
MKILTTLFFLVSLAGAAWAGQGDNGNQGGNAQGGNGQGGKGNQGRGTISAAPGPEMSAGVLGMTLAAGVLYLIKRRNRT